MVEQRPFKALVPGSSPGRPTSGIAWVYILCGSSGRYYIGSTENLYRRLSEHQRGSNHTTHRFGDKIELIAASEIPTISDARKLELKLKKKKNPTYAIETLQRFHAAR